MNETIFKKKRDDVELKGMTAFPGKVTGRARLILSNKINDIQKIHDGDMLSLDADNESVEIK